MIAVAAVVGSLPLVESPCYTATDRVTTHRASGRLRAWPQPSRHSRRPIDAELTLDRRRGL